MKHSIVFAFALSLFVPGFAQAQDDSEDLARRLVEKIVASTRDESSNGVDQTDHVADPADRAVALEVRRVLATRKVSLNFDKLSWTEAFDFIRDITDLNIVISREARDVLDSNARTVSLRLKDLRLRNALILTIEQLSEELAFGIQKGVLVIGLKTELRRRSMILRLYDIAEIIKERPDYPAPEVGLGGVTPMKP